MFLAVGIAPIFSIGTSALEDTHPGMAVEHTAYGDLITLQLSSAPFPHPVRQNGFTYDGDYFPADEHYRDSSVAVFIPKGFAAKGSVDLVFFFHGWNTTIDESRTAFDLIRQFAQSGVNGLLVLPEVASDAPDSFGGKLEETNGFSRLVNELLQRLSGLGVIPNSTAGNLILAGHSGAWRVIAQILKLGGMTGSIGEVYLFDALYDWMDRYAQWIESGNNRFVSVTIPGSVTSQNAQALMDTLRGDGIRVVQGKDDPSQDAGRLEQSVVFLDSSSDHFGVVSAADEFRRFLSTSGTLERISRY